MRRGLCGGIVHSILVENYYLFNLLFTAGYTLAMIVFVGHYTPDDPKTWAFNRYLIAVVAWAFFDALISHFARQLAPESSFTLFRGLSLLWIFVPSAALELIQSLIRPVTWLFRAYVYIPFGLIYLVGLFIPGIVSTREHVNPIGFLDPFGPWYAFFMGLTLVLTSAMLVRLGLSARREGDSEVRKEKLVLTYGGFAGILGQGVAQWLRASFGPDFPMLGNLFVAPVAVAAFWCLKHYGRVISPRSLYRSIVQLIPSGIAHVRNGRFIWTNRSLALMLGMNRPGELEGREIEEFLHHPHCNIEDSQIFRMLRSLDEIADREVSLVNSKGRTVDCLVSLVHLNAYDPGQGALLSFTDLTRLKEVQRDLERSLALSTHLRIQAEEANRAKSQFLANMSHELRTPLNAVIGFSEILEDEIAGGLSDTQRRYVGHVLSSGHHLLRLINDILDLEKVENGTIRLELTEVQLRPLLEDSLVMIQEEAERRALSIYFHIARELAGSRILVDEMRLKQIMANLLSNAVKFTPDGGQVVLKAWRSADELCVSVADSGIGLRREDLRRIFNAFEQVDASYSRAHQGTGLGLALTKNLVELHGGRIWAESKGCGRGSTFKLTIPLYGEGRSEMPAMRDALI